MTRRERLIRVAMWVGLIVAGFSFENSAILGIATLNDHVYYTDPGHINWGVMRGRYALAVPHEAGGRSPRAAWSELFERSLLGFNLKIASGGLSPTYTRVTMITVPCWFVALVSAALTHWFARKLGLQLVWRRRQRRGFEAIVPGDVTSPLPVSRIEESTSSGPST